MSYGIQCCARCGNLEDGHTGPADRYLCSACRRAGWRQNSLGDHYLVEWYVVHIWHSGRAGWDAQGAIEAETPRAAYLAARELHPGKTVHVTRVLVEPCSPGGPNV